MKSVHLVIPDLFLPKDFAAEGCRGLSLPALEKLLGHGHSEIFEVVPLENLLCELFGVFCHGDAPVAPISAAFDGLSDGCWLRADPVYLNLQRDQMLLAGMQPSVEEAAQFCASLNAHFAGQDIEFFVPHPQRWYVRLDKPPRICTTPPSEVLGGNVRNALPVGEDAARWHQLFNEIQMLLFAHPINHAREERGDLMINSVWFWGGGCSENVAPQKNYDAVVSDEMLAGMLAAAAGIPFTKLTEQWSQSTGEGKQLLVWTGLSSSLQRGDLAAWRESLQDFETGYAQPLWQALLSGKLAQLQLDIRCEYSIRRVQLKRGDAWAFWRRARPLVGYSMV